MPGDSWRPSCLPVLSSSTSRGSWICAGATPPSGPGAWPLAPGSTWRAEGRASRSRCSLPGTRRTALGARADVGSRQGRGAWSGSRKASTFEEPRRPRGSGARDDAPQTGPLAVPPDPETLAQGLEMDPHGLREAPKRGRGVGEPLGQRCGWEPDAGSGMDGGSEEGTG